MSRWSGRVAVVTGASVGIGAAVTKDLVKEGLIVVALARRVELIEQYRQTLPSDQQKRLHAIRTDLADKASIDQAFDWVIKELGGVDVLINNAGTSERGALTTISLDTVENTVKVNVLAVVQSTQRAVQSIKERNAEGHIVIINSRLGHRIPPPPPNVKPFFNMYPPTKYAITAIAEILRQEFSAEGGKIKITSVSPGLVNTEFLTQAFKDNCRGILQPEEVSSAVLYALSTPQSVQVSEITLQSSLD